MAYLLGIDIGSSSIKASLLDPQTDRVVGSGQFPDEEMPIAAAQVGWAEQDPQQWWDAARQAVARALQQAHASGAEVDAIGIAYQMHGLVCVDEAGEALRPSIIWCDSRAVQIGQDAFDTLGADACLSRLLNSPGNFTASKLKWVRDNEPDLFAKIHKIMLPGDYLAARLTGTMATTVSGLSEGMLWDFSGGKPADMLLDHYGIDAGLLADPAPTFGPQGELTAQAAQAFGLKAGTPVTYRAGDQPNNALSLNVLRAGEIAATAGTSGVVYGVSDTVKYDPQSRINTFAHVNHQTDSPSLGLLLCINGTGIANAWVRRTLGGKLGYAKMNDLAATAPIGSDGVAILPFGNGAERMLGNAEVGASIQGVNFNRHGDAELCRAVQEGIVFSFCYGIDILRETGVDLKVIRAGNANMFLSPIFRDTLAAVTGAQIELYDTDGSVGAARGAGIGAGVYADADAAFARLEKVGVTTPDTQNAAAYQDAYQSWRGYLQRAMA